MKNIDWFKKFDQVCNIDLSQDINKGIFPKDGHVQWFMGGKLNLSYNCIDRHIVKNPSYADKVALIHETNDPNKSVHITYGELLKNVSKLANCLKRMGIKKGDKVCVYMSTNPYSVYALLACARIGAIHVVVFAGFSSESLAERIRDAECKLIIANEKVIRGTKVVNLKPLVDDSVKICPSLNAVLLYREQDNHTPIPSTKKNFYFDLKVQMEKERPICPCEWMDSEDPLFILYTSGSTGKPKGMIHTQAGYLLGTFLTTKYIFNVHPGDVFGSMVDIGWITGHSYIIYGPLSNGVTTLLFDTVPFYPNHGRYWDTIQRHKVTQLYLSPTAIRALMKYPDDKIDEYDLSTLKVLGSVGEPINPTEWEWYFERIGKKKCPIVDTYWQTEGGSICLSSIPGTKGPKAGSCSSPFLGIKPVILDTNDMHVVEGNDKKGVLAIARPWPSISRTIFKNHDRYLAAYFNNNPGFFSTSDGGYRDRDEYYWVIGRVDDVINVSGHRLGSSEIESALNSHPSANESAVIGIPHNIKGTSIVAFVVLKAGFKNTTELPNELSTKVRNSIGGLAIPEKIYIVDDLPKTRSGKILRRLLRKIVTNTLSDNDDFSTLADPEVVDKIKKMFIQ